MDDRLVPILAAAVGVVGGVGGALVGGVLTNESQERQAERNRAAAVQDMRIDAYSNFLGAAQRTADALDPGHTKTELNESSAQLLIAQARVAVVHQTDDVNQRAFDVLVALEDQDPDAYRDAVEAFRIAAREEIAATAEVPE